MSDQDCSHPCGGHCCRAFFLPFSPEELKEKQDQLEDGPQIVAMVRHLGQFKTPPINRAHPVEQDHGGGHWYTCANLTEEGLCGIYEDRPRMCRGYPYGASCNYAKCEAACRAEGRLGERVQG